MIVVAQLGWRRDAKAERPDWSAIARLLQQSYRELREALASVNV